MDTLGQRGKIRIVSTNDQASMIGMLTMQAYKMSAIQGYQDTLLTSRKIQHSLVR